MTSKTVDGTETDYTYDNIDQILSEAKTGYSAAYTYDANGNRASKTLNGVTDTYTVDNGDKLNSISESGTTVKSYGYDAAGRTTSVVTGTGATTLAYDDDSRITSITYPDSSKNSFVYNGLDARTSKTDSTGSYTYKRDGADAADIVLSDGAANYTPGVSERRSGATLFEHMDKLGSMTAITNSAQTETDTRQYDAFGMLVGISGSTPTPFDFAAKAGYQSDLASGLMSLGHRYYDASIGRFITTDPVKDGRNWYAYCSNAPLHNTDPTGYSAGAQLNGPVERIFGKDGLKAWKNLDDDTSKEVHQRLFKEGPGGRPSDTDDDAPKIRRNGDATDQEIVDEVGPEIGMEPLNPKLRLRRADDPTDEMVRDLAQGFGAIAVSVVAVGAWEGGKWVLALVLAPETAGGSLAVAALIP